ncbi:SDR family NAD(P)-dependent oxidoreductase [Pediococcus claussenii]|uniref:Short chain dehydrogenase family protein n=1 Tax=Pediococcus claussenii (strain ATCC BAA-344 / DSM 14800 / JCM 18046 / KCTC 3811 / LMG 21948 / P06) TaxID=701521 RepID=G8PBS8_PEDCP|nr:SDR family NAD(P)-dependent oxidoreductase [Pediococcus claussenii]AEV95986.1 short chain dehydrogenase family protein [Pediococcus claussenii ATCC BAA-344]ANZ69472.1 carbonyl reductase [Pediococcus claussenii]ANZ71292.1 carbonyl reductase [Pediococcus claussenii]
MVDKDEIITLITGANRGMGFETAKELGQSGQLVIIGSRNIEKGKEAVKKLTQQNIKADYVELDVTNTKSVSKAQKEIEKKYGRLNILINNAGAVFSGRQLASNLNFDDLRSDMELNYFGLIDVTQRMLPLLKKSEWAKIINISSMMGSKTAALDPNSEVYRAVAVGYQSAKAAANMYTVQLAKELRAEDQAITVNAIDPGMVATEFGGATPEQAASMGAKPIEFGVARTVELATDYNDRSNGTFTNTHGVVGW